MDFTGTFDSLMVDFATKKQKAVLTLNEDARQLYDNLKGCEKISITIKKYRKKRSLDANAYFHVLAGKIADALNISKPRSKNILIGRHGQPELLDDGSPAIMKTNVPVEKMMEQETLHCYPCGSKTENGIELTFYRIYRGSHTYDTKEMSILIDGTIADAKELGIETIPPDELKRMKEQWGVDIGKETSQHTK